MRVGRTLTHHFEIETRQYDLLGIDLGEGARRRMIIFGAVIILLWIALLFPFIGVPQKSTVSLYVVPPFVITAFGWRAGKFHERRRRVTEWALAVRYALRAHRPIIGLGARAADKTEYLPWRERIATQKVAEPGEGQSHPGVGTRGRGGAGSDGPRRRGHHGEPACPPARGGPCATGESQDVVWEEGQMKIADKLLNLVGVGRERGLPPPRLVAIADGLLVTERSAEAWFLISVANTDLATEAEQDAALDAAVSAAATILGDRLSHLKVVWGRSTGQDYIDSVAGHYRLGDHEAWAQTRADRIDEMRMPERYVALGVHLSDRDPRATAQVRGSISDALGTTSWRVSARELAHLDERVRKLGRQLGSTVWRAHTAPAEVISWLISREMHRGAVAAPRRGLITGASLARLTSGRVVPYTDHLRIYDARGQIAAYTTVLAMTDFPEELETPGAGEWLRTLSEIKAIDDDGDEIDVTVEASVRFRVLTKKTARQPGRRDPQERQGTTPVRRQGHRGGDRRRDRRDRARDARGQARHQPQRFDPGRGPPAPAGQRGQPRGPRGVRRRRHRALRRPRHHRGRRRGRAA